MAYTCSLTVAFGLTTIATEHPAVADVTDQDIQSLEAMAFSGAFEDLLGQIDDRQLASSEAQSLRADLDRYNKNQAARAEARQEALDESLDELTKSLKNQHLEEALVAAIDAHSQAEDDAFFEREDVTALSKAARENARQATEAGDWLESAALYRLLNLLYEVDSRFSDEQKVTSEHLRVLQMYAPVRFQDLADERLEELKAKAETRKAQDEQANGEPSEETAEEEADPPKIAPDKWQDRLISIDRQVLERTLSECVEEHINGPTYKQMLMGGIEQLLVLMRTPEAEESFPKFDDTTARERFIERLTTMHAELAKTHQITLQQTKSRISAIESANDITVALPDEVLFYELTEGATDTIDAFTYVIWPADHKEFMERTLRGEIYGVGIQIAREAYKLTVVTPLGNTPAHRAGLKAGDVIETVNGYATSAWSLKRAVNEITGKEGTPVTLGIRREGEPELLIKRLIRAKIPIESVRGWDHDPNGKWDYWIDQHAGVGYIRMTQFVQETAADLDKAIAELQKTGKLNGLILDLRFNPGGLLQSAVEVVDRFVPSGDIVGQVDADGRHIPRSVYKAHKENTLPDVPVAVLINQGSASAAEIVSGALQDFGRATVIGERTYGKGSVQKVEWYPSRFSPRWGVRVTTSHYTLPSGRVIHREEESTAWGVEPELVVPMTERQVAKSVEYRREVDVLRDPDEEQVPVGAILEEGMDPQLESAILILKTQILTDHLELTLAKNTASDQNTATP